MRILLRWFLVALLGLSSAQAAVTPPPKPPRYFNDYANLVRPDTAARLNTQLEEFEKATSSQIVVAIFPKLPPNAALEDFAVQTFRAWGVGQKDKNNGLVLFVFVQDRKMRIEVGYGLEGVVPDAIANRIIQEQISPAFKSGNFDDGLTAGVAGLMAAARGEYKGTGRTVDQGRPSSGRNRNGLPPAVLIPIIIFFIIAGATRRRKRGVFFGRRHHQPWSGWSTWGGSSSWGGGSGWSSGGGGFSGGGFSGGGGRSGGGGASGGW